MSIYFSYFDFFYTFAPSMKLHVKYSVFSWAILVAFVFMVVVKATHHHLPHEALQTECVVDHTPLSDCSHSHASLINLIADDNDCAICHFLLAKILPPLSAHYWLPTLVFCRWQPSDYSFLPDYFFAHCPGRAPPC